MLPPPVVFGLPDKFSEWRSKQDEAVLRSIDSEKRFVVQALPTGFGKSPSYIAEALMTGKRAVVLTSTKALQSQLLKDFEECGLVDVRGQGNYQCRELPENEYHNRCDNGPCHVGYKCHQQKNEDGSEPECLYFGAVWRAVKSELVVTNYPYWIHQNQSGGGLGEVELLVLDECFPEGTDVGGKPIEEIRVGDWVPSIDLFGTVCRRRVLKTFRRRYSKPLVKIVLRDGRSIVSTPSHPFRYSRGAWKEASALDFCDSVLCLPYEKNKIPNSSRNGLQLVQKSNHSRWPTSLLRLQKKWKSLLPLKRLFKAIQDMVLKTKENEQRIKGEAFREDEKKEPDERPCSEGENEIFIEANGMETANTRGERKRGTIAATASSLRSRVGDGSIRFFRREEERIPNELQSGYREQDPENRNRSRRNEPHELRKEIAGQEKTGSPYWIGVDHTEVLEPSSPEWNRYMSPDCYVYNLEVEGIHAYLANGVLVHNCHSAPDELSDCLTVRLDRIDVEGIAGSRWPTDYGDDLRRWQEWAKTLTKSSETALNELRGRWSGSREVPSNVRRHVRVLKELGKRLGAVCTAKGEWVVDYSEKAIMFCPLWPAEYAESHLFCGVKKVLLVSATVRPKTCEILGIRDYEFIEYPSPFPVDRRPVIHIPTVRMNNRTDDAGLRYWVDRIDQIIDRRLDRKGIIHTVAYHRRDYVMRWSRHAGIMMSHSPDNTASQVEKFRRTKSPCVMVSPSLGTGYDFDGDSCRYQIIGKIAFPDTRNKVMEARCKADKEYGSYLAAQELVQSAGRSTRSIEDWSEVFVVDDNLTWFLPGNKSLFPQWFREAVVWAKTVPDPIR